MSARLIAAAGASIELGLSCVKSPGDERLEVGAPREIEPTAGLDRVGVVVLGGELAQVAEYAVGAELEGVHAPVRDQPRRRTQVEGDVRSRVGGEEDVRVVAGAELDLRQQHEAADPDAERIERLEAEQPRRTAIEERVDLDLEQGGIEPAGGFSNRAISSGERVSLTVASAPSWGPRGSPVAMTPSWSCAGPSRSPMSPSRSTGRWPVIDGCVPPSPSPPSAPSAPSPGGSSGTEAGRSCPRRSCSPALGSNGAGNPPRRSGTSCARGGGLMVVIDAPVPCERAGRGSAIRPKS